MHNTKYEKTEKKPLKTGAPSVGVPMGTAGLTGENIKFLNIFCSKA